MRYYWIFVLAVMFVIGAAAAQDGDDDLRPLVPDLRGMTVAQAAAALHENQLQLMLPVTQADPASGQINRVSVQNPVAGTRVDAGTAVTVSVPRQPNLLLVYDRSNFDDHDFHIVNLGDEAINLYGIELQAEDSSRTLSTRIWGNLLLPRQCVQAWDFAVNAPYQPPECRAVQGAGGVLRDVALNRRVWQDTERLRVVQDGVLRAECAIADGRCALWVSPQEIAEDVTPYIYMVYDRDRFTVLNRSTSQWMPLFETRIEDNRPLSDGRLWDRVAVPDLTLLAPGQCVRFVAQTQSGTPDESAPTCAVVAERVLSDADIFWRGGFTVTAVRNGIVRDTCPPAIAGGAVCLLPR